jgi:sigma-B regulation protein RsbU (phosphoserine phosphatase)
MFPARVYVCEYKDARGQRVGDAYAILSQAALESGGGMGPWTLVTPLLVALAVGLILFQISQAAQGLQSLSRDLEAIGRGKLDLRVAVRGPAEVAAAQRAAERMAKNLQLIQTTGSGDLDEALAKELDLATQIHQSLRPKDPPRVPGFELETLFKPGRDIGGDYFDYLDLDGGRLALVIADCAEGVRGVPAAMVMAMTRAYLQTAVDPAASPVEWLKAANRRLSRDLRSGMAVTCQIAVLNPATGEVVAASAGHRPIVLWRQGKTATVNPNGIALGLDVGPVFDKTIEEKRFTLQKNDRIVLHTDGVVSAANEAGEPYGEERFLESIRRQGAMNSAAFVNFVAGGVDQFLAGLEQNDDITVLTCKRMK